MVARETTEPGDFLGMLCCPETQQPLHPIDSALLARLNQAIREKALRKVSGNLVEAPMEAALVREDKMVCYPIERHIPILLGSEAISLLPFSQPHD